MPEERPPGEYDWLFDPNAGRTPTHSGTPAPPRPSTPPGVLPNLPPPNLPPPSRTVRPGVPGRASNWRRWVGLTVVCVPILWIGYLIAVPFMAWASVSTVQAFPDSARPADQPGTTYLIVGSDSRKGLTTEEQKELKTGKDIDNGGRGRTDTIMLLHAGAGKPVLVSIPRDSIVPIPGYGTQKINASYAFGGPELLVQTLESNTGVRIDQFVEIGFAGVVKLVDAVGGVEICPKQDAKDKDSGLDIKKGCQVADGKTALAYSRTRHAYATGDIQRVQNQREVIAGLGSKLRSPATVIDPIRYYQVINGGASVVTVDDGAGIPAMAKFGLALSSAMGSGGLSCNVPISDLAVHWDPVRAPQFWDHLKTDTTDQLGDLCTKDGLPPS
jgi:LCP family protein required for cell wall assembly